MSDQTVTVMFSGHVALRDCFSRSQPASLEGPPEAWEAIRDVVDHGCFILNEVTNVRQEHGIRDVVAAALLRRLLITAESIRLLIAAGLEESAVVVFRTFLELDVNLRLMFGAEGDHMAKRLAAHYFVKGRRHFAKLLGDAEVRTRIRQDPEHWDWSTQTSRRFREFLESSAFDEVREAVEADANWHGHDSIAAAFKAAGVSDDYLTLYDTFSPFCHGSNLEQDLVAVEDGQPKLRALAQRDPTRTMNMLKGLGFKLIGVYHVFLDDKGNPEYQPPLEAKTDAGDSFPITAIDALTGRLLEVFGEIEDNGAAPGAADVR